MSTRSGQQEDIILFSDKRMREHRRRCSVTSIDDTDYLMEIRNARRRSIVMMNDDNDAMAWNHIWRNVSPENIRNLLPMNKTNSSNGEEGGGGLAVLKNPVPKLGQGGNDKDAETVATADETDDSSNRQSSSSSFSLSSASSSSSNASWCNRLDAISRWERRQEKAYHDTLDERNKANTLNSHQQRQWFRHPRSYSRDGLDFSRDVALAGGRQESFYALADSFTQFSATDGVDNNTSNSNNNNNGHLQDTRTTTKPKREKCLLDLIA